SAATTTCRSCRRHRTVDAGGGGTPCSPHCRLRARSRTRALEPRRSDQGCSDYGRSDRGSIGQGSRERRMESGRGRRPYVVASCAMSVDGLIDDASDRRLVLSNDADLDRVDQVRAECDAILVGAETVRRDNPRLLVRSARRRRLRREEGRPDSPLKVTLTRSGDLDPAARFFTEGGAETLVYAASAAYTRTRDRLGSVTTVVDAGSSPEPDEVLADLWARGV